MKAELEEKRFSEFHPMPEAFFNGRIGGENVYFGVFNYFAPDEMLTILRTLNWQKPKNVQLFVRDMEDEIFSVFTLNDLKPIEKPLLSLVRPDENTKPFAGQLFAFDGTMTLLSRAQWSEIIERGGSHVTYAVSERTTCLIGGENNETETEKAYRLGIPFVAEHEFHDRHIQNKS